MFKKIEGERKDRKHKRNYREFHKIYISIKGKKKDKTAINKSSEQTTFSLSACI